MKKQLLLFIFFLYFQTFSSVASVKDNTFTATIENNSDFFITIDNERIEPHGRIKHRFPLHESALYDGWSVEYEILLTQSVTYLLQEKIYIADRQKSIKITNPDSGTIDDTFVIIHNASSESFQITDSKNEKIYPCYESGIINKSDIASIYNIAAGKSVVCKIPKNEIYAINPFAKNKAGIKLPCSLDAGYAYKIDLTEGGAKLTDKRPLEKLCESLWDKEFKNEIVRSISQKDNKIFLISTKEERDGKDNLFTAGFLKCLDSYGNEIWKQEYAIKNTDTFFYDMTSYYDENILIAGQSIASKMTGLLLQYTSNGELLRSISVPECIGLDMITPLKSSYSLRGYDNDGFEKKFVLEKNSSGPKLQTVYKDDEPTAALIQSKSKCIEAKNGSLYTAGETAYLERPSATVICQNPENYYKPLAVYTAREPFSFVSDMILNEDESQLIMVGSINAKDSFGNDCTPFIRCFDLKRKEIIWENMYADSDYEVCAKIAPCKDYGYILLFVNADENGNVSLPCKITRTNATGKQ